MKEFWRTNGIRWDSIAQNTDANATWFAKLTHNHPKTQHGYNRRDLWLISFIYHAMLTQDRLLRPTARQVLERLLDMDLIYPVGSSKLWVDSCCTAGLDSTWWGRKVFYWDTPQWPILDLLVADNHLAHIVLNIDMETLATSDTLSNLDHISVPGAVTLERILEWNEVQLLKKTAHSMLKYTGHHEGKVNTSNIQLDSITNSIFTCPLEKTIFWVAHLVVYLGGVDEPPSIRTVQLSLHTICLERQEGYRSPFLVMTFDPNEGEALSVMEFDPAEDISVPIMTFDPNGSEAQFPQTSHRRGGDLWTDGVSIAGATFERQKLERYASFKSQVVERQRQFRNQVSSF
jgi:hypothetical protein